MPGEISKEARNILNCANELSRADSKRKAELVGNIEASISRLYKSINIEKKDVSKKVLLPKPQAIMPKARKDIPAAPAEKIAVPQFDSGKFRNLTKEEKKKAIAHFNLNYEEIKEFVKLQKDKQKGKKIKIKIAKVDYSIYEPSSIGKIANKYMKKYADSLITKYPGFFEPMFRHFKMVEMELLSRSYVSMMLFFTLISFPAIFLFFLILNFAFKLSILTILGISILGIILTFFGFYFYPASLIGGRSSKIKLEYPFAVVHMSAVAGSGASPISIFELIAESDDYPELRKEVKKIMNYVNLFGYSLTNAMKSIAATTPNPEFKELLDGMVSTVETGGDLRGYLNEKAMDALNIYKLDRKKQVEALGTYSEVYTAILIASPLLLLVTLAIINSIGGNIAGMSVKTVAWIGIAGILPLLNVGFMVFVNVSQKGL